jgi:hypothetical protein
MEAPGSGSNPTPLSFYFMVLLNFLPNDPMNLSSSFDCFIENLDLGKDIWDKTPKKCHRTKN